MTGKLVLRRPVLDDDVDILKASPEVLRYRAQGHSHQPLECLPLHAAILSELRGVAF